MSHNGGKAVERNRLIDGWRGVCVLLLIIDHVINFHFAEHFGTVPFRQILSAPPIDVALLTKNIVLRFPHTLAQLGLNVFLVISGYLITKQLIREESKAGLINIKAYYVRRFFRIVPTFYTFLIISFFITKFGAIPVTFNELFSAGAFLCNTPLGHCGWWYGHTFTLSIQEQFYIIWPLGFVLLGPLYRGRGLTIIFSIFLVLSYFGSITFSWINNAMYFGSIAAGALYASSKTVARIVDEKATGTIVLFVIILVASRPVFASLSTVIILFDLITPAAVAVIFFGSLKNTGFSAAILSNAFIGKIGTVSFSLYLWQQLFTGKPPYSVVGSLSASLFLLLATILSYLLVERPTTRLGHRLSSQMIEYARANSRPIYTNSDD